ncbi:MAG: FHA domain-containing protein [Lachnospiraceae bacterium]|nr:FHA domain-containing protein [Lachnospiraceae bacterium]
MNKVVVIKKKKEKYVYVKLLPNQAINNREIEMLNSGRVYQLISPETNRKNTELLYKVSNYVSLKEYLQSVTSKTKFINIVLSILDMIKESQGMMLHTKNFILNTEHIFIEIQSKKLMYVYLPIVNYDAEIDFSEIFYNLAFDTVFNQFEDCSYVKEYINYFNVHPNFSVYDFETFIREMNGENISYGDKKVNIESSIQPKKKADTIFQNTMYASTSDLDRKIANVAHPSKILSNTKNESNSEINETSILGAANYGTTVLDEAEQGTTILSSEILGVTKVIYPTIIRKNTNEEIYINKNCFTVGKSSTSDYCINDNNAISRKHASIITTNDNRYFIIDENSTNGTYIDDIKIESKIEIEILPNQLLRFADVEFEFKV